MIITNIQLPKGIVGSQDSKGTQNQGDFLATLTQSIKTNIKESGKVKLGELDDVPADEGEPTDDRVSQLGVFLNLSLYENKTTDEMKVNLDKITSDLQTVECIEATNKAMSQFTESISETQVEFLVGNDVLMANGNIASENKEVTSVETDLSSGIIEKDLMVDPKKIPDTHSTKPLEEKLQLDKNPNIDNKNEHKDDFIDGVNSEVIREVGKDGLKLKDNSTRKSNDTAFNNYIQENKTMKVNVELGHNEQVLPKENLLNINETILRLVETTTEGGSSVMKVQLYPEELGTINVVLKLDKGKVSTSILVDNDQIKQLFISKVSEISENLFKQNINLDKVEVELNPNTSFNSNSHFNSSENFNRNNREQFKYNQFIRFESELISKEIVADNYSNTGAISILA